jgi:hypothetical protein
MAPKSKSSENNNDDDENENEDTKKRPPPEQSGYYILDLREKDSWDAGPWLQLIPKHDDQDEEDEEIIDNTKANSKAAIAAATIKTKYNQKKPQRVCKTCHIPISELKNRCYELPAKRSNLVLVFDTWGDETQAEQIMYSDWNIVYHCKMTGARNTSCISRDLDWVESATWMCSEIDQPKCTKTKLVYKKGPTTIAPDDLRAWSPSPFLEKHLDSIIIPKIKQNPLYNNNNTENKIPSKITAIDVGAGNGRDIAFLASRGIFDQFFAIDNRAHLLENCKTMANRYNTKKQESSSSTAFVCHGVYCNIANDLPIATNPLFHEEMADLIVCVRFLERPLLPNLAKYLKVGGFLLYSHFVDGVQNSAVGQPKSVKHYVLHGELKKKIVDEAVLPKSFGIQNDTKDENEDEDDDEQQESVRNNNDNNNRPAEWLKILIDEEVLLEDGRPVNNLLIWRVL